MIVFYNVLNLETDVDIYREKYIKPSIKSSILKETVYAD